MRSKGFTLVEILIVVIILAILAMIAMPRFTRATNDARLSALQSDLHTLRQQIELYKAHHAGRGPHVNEAGSLDTANFTARLLSKTDPDGTLNANGVCGPYLRAWPKNPFSPAETAQQVKFGKTDGSPVDGTTGWFFSTRSLMIYGNAGAAE